MFITPGSSEMINFSSMPNPKQVKKKALLVVKARKEPDEEELESQIFFPTGVEREVIFMEITGKLLTNLYSSCHVSGQLF